MFGFYEDHFTIFGLDIAYYGFIIAVAMALGVFVACKNAKLRGLRTDDIILLACYVLPLAVIGARIYYVIFADQSFSFVEILRIWDGGMAIYGGVIGGAIGVMLFCFIHKHNFLDVGDIAAPSLILGQSIGRIGCYFSQCCYGIEVTDPSLQWFPLSTQIGGTWHLSTMFYESLWDLLLFIALMLILRKGWVKQRGSIVGLYFIGYGVGRAWIEALRGDSLYLGAIKVSQLLSIILIIAGIALILTMYILHRKGKVKNLSEIDYRGMILARNEAEQNRKNDRAKARAEKKANKQNIQQTVQTEPNQDKEITSEIQDVPVNSDSVVEDKEVENKEQQDKTTNFDKKDNSTKKK